MSDQGERTELQAVETVEAVSEPAAASSSSEAVPATPSSRLGWLALAVSSAALVAALGSGYWMQQQRLQQPWADALAVQDQQQRQHIAMLQAQLDQREQQMQQLLRADEQAQQWLRAVEERQDQQAQQLAALSTTDRSDWLLAEAEYLLRLANQRLLMARDSRAAQGLLHSADLILREVDEVALHPVRRALAQDIQALRAVNQVDVEGLYLQLSALAQQISQLTLIAPPAAPDLAERRADTWQGWWEQLLSLVQVRHLEQPYQPLLSPQFEGAVRQSLRLMLEQAQSALLSGNAVLYRESLQHADQWLATYFTLQPERVAPLQQTLHELQAQPVAATLPLADASLQALRAYLLEHRQRGAVAEEVR